MVTLEMLTADQSNALPNLVVMLLAGRAVALTDPRICTFATWEDFNANSYSRSRGDGGIVCCSNIRQWASIGPG